MVPVNSSTTTKQKTTMHWGRRKAQAENVLNPRAKKILLGAFGLSLRTRVYLYIYKTMGGANGPVFETPFPKKLCL